MKVQGNLILFGVGLLLLGTLVYAASEPTAPTSLTQSSSSTFNGSNYALQTVPALAGNITALLIHGVAQTKAWQGYYGNITGSITLDDVNNYTFYNWSSAEPQGKIYATLNSSIAWNAVECFNFTNTSDAGANVSTIESYYGIVDNDDDGIDETFTATDHPTFQVGSRSLTGCPTTYIYQDDTIQTSNFVNVLLYDAQLNGTGWIYTTLIENQSSGATNDLICYNNEECDFQILVNEDGHGTNVATTTYYFWVELN